MRTARGQNYAALASNRPGLGLRLNIAVLRPLPVGKNNVRSCNIYTPLERLSGQSGLIIYTVFHKKRFSTFVVITLEDLDEF